MHNVFFVFVIAETLNASTQRRDCNPGSQWAGV